MDDLPEPIELSCPKCRWRTLCGAEQMLQRLQSVGMFRRAKTPEGAILTELFQSSLDRFSCPECGGGGLLAEAPRDEGDWPTARICQSCGQPITPERLEIFPAATLCAPCQTKAPSGQPAREPEFCPRCGALMQIRQSRSAGITRYVLKCSQCGR